MLPSVVLTLDANAPSMHRRSQWELELELCRVALPFLTLAGKQGWTPRAGTEVHRDRAKH